MATVTDAWAMAITHLQAGRHNEAAQICQQIVASQPDFADAWHLLGVIALQTGQPEGASYNLERAVAANPADAEAFNNLGIARKSAGQWENAIESFRSAVALRPDFAEAHYNLANAYHERGRIDEAMDGYRRALELRPADAVIHNNLANALRDKGNLDEAIAAYRRAIDLQPTYAEAHYNLGNAYQQANLDNEAIACFRQAVELNPNYAEAYSNLGTILKDLERLDEAAACFSRALELKPLDAELNYNSGLILMAQGRLVDAAVTFERSLTLEPSHAWAHVMRSQLNLVKENFEEGWKEYEWRWRTKESPPREFLQPQCDGQALNGKTILLHAEQGLGDTIQFIRYASKVKRLGGTVVVECPKSLLRLLASYGGVDQLVGQGDDLPTFDVHAPLLSLPRIFGTNIPAIPADVPYLFAESSLVAEWREKLAQISGYRIGINWQGRPGRGSFRQRDIPLNCFAAVAAVPGVRLISLQRGTGQHDLTDKGVGQPILDLGDQIDQRNGPFMDTAGIMKNLDLVITSDTSIPHLAGALGVPVWLALPSAADWRWLLDRSDSPWYPTMRLFRQKSPGDWTSVFEDIRAALCERL